MFRKSNLGLVRRTLAGRAVAVEALSARPESAGTSGGQGFAVSRRVKTIREELGGSGYALDQVLLFGFIFGADGEGVEQAQAESKF